MKNEADEMDLGKKVEMPSSDDIKRVVTITEWIEIGHELDGKLAEQIERKSKGSKKSCLKNFTRRELLVIILLCYGNFCTACSYSLLAPFYPREAEAKGIDSFKYGFVFGIDEFCMFLMCPLIGKLMPRISARFLLIAGLLLSGICSIFFGSLVRISSPTVFYVLCLTSKAIESIGGSAFFTANYTILSMDFPKHVGKLFACLEMFYGLGMIVGPAIGGFLYQLGRDVLPFIGAFSLPFYVMGSSLILGASILFWLLPRKKSNQGPKTKQTSMLRLLLNPSITLNILISWNSFVLLGFNDSTLERHIDSFTYPKMEPSIIALIFVLYGLTYAISNQVWGLITEKLLHSHVVCSLGILSCLIGYIIVGPLPFLPYVPCLWNVLIAQVLFGIGMAAQLVGSFVEGLNETIKCGFPANVSTYAMISGIYSSAFSLGAAIGPSAGGILVTHIGYQWSTFILGVLQVIMISFIIMFHLFRGSSKSISIESDESEGSQGQHKDLGYTMSWHQPLAATWSKISFRRRANTIEL